MTRSRFDTQKHFQIQMTNYNHLNTTLVSAFVILKIPGAGLLAPFNSTLNDSRHELLCGFPIPPVSSALWSLSTNALSRLMLPGLGVAFVVLLWLRARFPWICVLRVYFFFFTCNWQCKIKLCLLKLALIAAKNKYLTEIPRRSALVGGIRAGYSAHR